MCFVCYGLEGGDPTCKRSDTGAETPFCKLTIGAPWLNDTLLTVPLIFCETETGAPLLPVAEIATV